MEFKAIVVCSLQHDARMCDALCVPRNKQDFHAFAPPNRNNPICESWMRCNLIIFSFSAVPLCVFRAFNCLMVTRSRDCDACLGSIGGKTLSAGECVIIFYFLFLFFRFSLSLSESSHSSNNRVWSVRTVNSFDFDVTMRTMQIKRLQFKTNATFFSICISSVRRFRVLFAHD